MAQDLIGIYAKKIEQEYGEEFITMLFAERIKLILAEFGAAVQASTVRHDPTPSPTESDQEIRVDDKPLAWGVMRADGTLWGDLFDEESAKHHAREFDSGIAVPLYAHPVTESRRDVDVGPLGYVLIADDKSIWSICESEELAQAVRLHRSNPKHWSIVPVYAALDGVKGEKG